MEHTIEKPLGEGLSSSNSIIFSSGIGVRDSVSSSISWLEILNLAANPQNVPKTQAHWILPNDCPIRKRYSAEYSLFGLLWADIDEAPAEGISAVAGALLPSTPYLIYATKSATFEAQKCRVLIPLAHQVEFSTWLFNQNNLNKVLAKANIEADSCNLNPAQVLFLPNRGVYYNHNHRVGLFKAKAPPKATHPPHTMALQKPIQPRSTPPGIDRFKSAYSVADILRMANYEQCPHDPMRWRHPASESGSYSATISPKTGRVHSLSSADPLYTEGGGRGAHDAFSAFCVLSCDGDMSLAVYRAANEWLSEVTNG